MTDTDYRQEVLKVYPDAYCAGPMKNGKPHPDGGYLVFSSPIMSGPSGAGKTAEEAWRSAYAKLLASLPAEPEPATFNEVEIGWIPGFVWAGPFIKPRVRWTPEQAEQFADYLKASAKEARGDEPEPASAPHLSWAGHGARKEVPAGTIAPLSAPSPKERVYSIKGWGEDHCGFYLKSDIDPIISELATLEQEHQAYLEAGSRVRDGFQEWKDRAETAESTLSALREAVDKAVDVLQKGKSVDLLGCNLEAVSILSAAREK